MHALYASPNIATYTYMYTDFMQPFIYVLPDQFLIDFLTTESHA